MDNNRIYKILKDGKLYASSKQLVDLGYKVIPLATLNSNNIPIFDDENKMVDLLIPFNMIDENLID